MIRQSGLVVIWALVLPAVGAAQGLPEQGERLRVRQADRSVIVGTLVSTSENELRLIHEVTGTEVAIPLSGVRAVEQSLGRQRDFGRYFGTTVAVSSFAFGVLGAATFEPCSGWLCIGPSNSGEAFMWGAVGGALVGVPVGLVLGLTMEPERWAPATATGMANGGLSIQPVVGTRVGFVASMPVGGGDPGP